MAHLNGEVSQVLLAPIRTDCVFSNQTRKPNLCPGAAFEHNKLNGINESYVGANYATRNAGVRGMLSPEEDSSQTCGSMPSTNNGQNLCEGHVAFCLCLPRWHQSWFAKAEASWLRDYDDASLEYGPASRPRARRRTITIRPQTRLTPRQTCADTMYGTENGVREAGGSVSKFGRRVHLGQRRQPQMSK